jgi:hypothetical protein
MSEAERCDVPPEGWWCSREKGHDGPCAAREVEPMSWEDLATRLQAEKIALRIDSGELKRLLIRWLHEGAAMGGGSRAELTQDTLDALGPEAMG